MRPSESVREGVPTMAPVPSATPVSDARNANTNTADRASSRLTQHASATTIRTLRG
jgi:hypothetical protein